MDIHLSVCRHYQKIEYNKRLTMVYMYIIGTKIRKLWSNYFNNTIFTYEDQRTQIGHKMLCSTNIGVILITNRHWIESRCYSRSTEQVFSHGLELLTSPNERLHMESWTEYPSLCTKTPSFTGLGSHGYYQLIQRVQCLLLIITLSCCDENVDNNNNIQYSVTKYYLFFVYSFNGDHIPLWMV